MRNHTDCTLYPVSPHGETCKTIVQCHVQYTDVDTVEIESIPTGTGPVLLPFCTHAHLSPGPPPSLVLANCQPIP